MVDPGFCWTSLARAATTSVSTSISKTVYSPSICWRPPCYIAMGCTFTVYSFPLHNDSSNKRYFSVNMVGGPPRDLELTISLLICLNFMRSLSLLHNLVTCVDLSLPDTLRFLRLIRPSTLYSISWTGIICTWCTAFIVKPRASSMVK